MFVLWWWCGGWIWSLTLENEASKTKTASSGIGVVLVVMVELRGRLSEWLSDVDISALMYR